MMMPEPDTVVGIEPKIDQRIVTPTAIQTPASANHPEGSVTCMSRSSCSGLESRSSAAWRKMDGRVMALPPEDLPKGTGHRCSWCYSCDQGGRGNGQDDIERGRLVSKPVLPVQPP